MHALPNFSVFYALFSPRSKFLVFDKVLPRNTTMSQPKGLKNEEYGKSHLRLQNVFIEAGVWA